MKKAFFICLLILSIALLCSCDSSKLSKSRAKDVIDDYIKAFYSWPVPKKVVVNINNAKHFGGIILANREGLITAKNIITAGKDDIVETMSNILINRGSVDIFELSLTEKGKSISSLSDDTGVVLFKIGQRSVDDIIEIRQDTENEYTVLFVFTIKNDEQFKHLVGEPKYRGKAKLVYDSFLKKFVLNNLLFSDWEKEKWRPASWVLEDKGKKKIVWGNIHLQ